MEYRRLGQTPFAVSRICFGALTVGPLGANLPPADGAEVIRKALELGVNFIDTAQYYQTYSHIATALQGWQGEVIISSKTYAEDIPTLRQAVEEARCALNRDRIEIFLLHEQRDAAAVQMHRPLLTELQRLKAAGKIGAVGISTHNVGAAAIAAEVEEIEVLHPLINREGVGINGGSVQEMIAAIQAVKAKGKGVYGMKSMGGGSLMRRAREMQAWALQQDFLDSVAIGMKDVREVITNIGWYEGQDPPEAAELPMVDRNLYFDACLGCGRCAEACQQGALVLDREQMTWQKDKCVFCGYCIPACPYFYISFA